MSNSSWLSFILGLTIGAGVVYLFTTAKGEELRQKMADLLEEKGIKLSGSELDELLEELGSRIHKPKKGVDNYGAGE
ncbi:MAG: YtxH domain-containing protein [Bacteroidales bacterium]